MSIVEVAKLAGVSHATVSRVINRHPRVSPDSARRVREAMKQLKYSPPAVRRGPRSKVRQGIRTHNVALLFLGADVSLQHAPIISTLVRGVERALAEQELNFNLAHVEPGKPLPRNVASGNVDGVILIGREPDPTTCSRLSTLPTVWLGSRSSKRWGDHVVPEEPTVARLALDYLTSHNRRNLAVINIETSHPGQGAYQRNFERFASEAGVSVASLVSDTARNETLIRPHAEEEALSRHVQALCALNPRPDGLFVAADLQTVVTQRLLAQAGVRIGDDLLIVSVNNEQVLLAGLDPRPATIDVGGETLGRRAVDQLLWRMRNPDEPRRVRVTVEPKLILPDGSTAGLDPSST